MQCRFNGEILTTDPVDQSASPVWDTELPWELEARVIHYLRSQRATLKLECYSLTAQGRRDMQGFIMLDLRAAQEAPGQEKWMPLLNVGKGAYSGYSSTRPEIKISFVVTGPHTSPPSTPGRKSVPVAPRILRLPGAERLLADSSTGAGGYWTGGAAGASVDRRHKEPVGVTLSTDGYYKVGSATDGLQNYVLSITVAFAEHLESLLDADHALLNEDEGGSVNGYCFSFTILGTEVSTSRFPELRDPTFPTEHVAIKFKGTPGDFARYLDEHAPVPVYLCHDTRQKLGRADITLGGVASQPSHVNEKMYPMIPCGGLLANSNCKANIGVSVEMATGEENLADAALVLPLPPAIAASVTDGVKRIESLPQHELAHEMQPGETSAVVGDGKQQEDMRPHPEPLPHRLQPRKRSTSSTSSDGTPGDTSVMTDGIRETAEYRTAIQLEMWKQQEEDRFRKQLQKREAQLLSQLADEWNRRDQEQAEMHRSKSEELRRLEDRTRALLTDLEQREKRLVEGEEALQRRKIEVAEEHARRLADAKDASRRLQEEFAQKLELEHGRTIEAERLREQAAEELREYKRMHRELEREYAEFRKSLAATPEASLREAIARERELRAEAETRLEGAVRSKRHYKAQWTRTLQEFSKLRRRQQAELEERLRREHQELDEMRLRYRAKEEQEIMASERRTLDDVRKELQDLKAFSDGGAGRESTGGALSTHPAPSAPQLAAADLALPERAPALAASQASLSNNDARSMGSVQPARSAYTSAPEPALCPAPQPALHPQVTSEIWRLEKEKDILLRSGVYTPADRLVQDLDTKINHLRTEVTV